MGYTIMYSRQFVKTNSGIIPIALYGSNNVTTYNPRTGREVRERSWDLLCSYSKTLDMFNVPADSLMQVVEAMYTDSDSEIWKQNGKWVDGAGAIRFFENGIKYAKTIEEIRMIHPAQSLDCAVTYYDQFGKVQVLLSRDCATTEAIEAFAEKAREAYKNVLTEGYHPYINMSFWGNEPLNCEKTQNSTKLTGAVIAKRKNGYVQSWTDKTLTCALQHVGDAHVFQSVEDAKEQLPACFAPYTFIDAKRALRPKLYVLLVSDGFRKGLYIQQLMKHSLYFTSQKENAKGFLTESAAQKWVEKYINTRFSQVKAVKILNKTEEETI